MRRNSDRYLLLIVKSSNTALGPPPPQKKKKTGGTAEILSGLGPLLFDSVTLCSLQGKVRSMMHCLWEIKKKDLLPLERNTVLIL